MCFYKPIPKQWLYMEKQLILKEEEKKGGDNHTLKNIYTVF